jgi:anaerobic magnesium-protoporphyrin IX monomethyl ester cyclase
MRINVSIINPPVFEIVEPYYDTPPFPRTALAFLAGHIRQNSKSINTNVIDAKFDKLNFQQTIDKILKFESNVIGITAMTNEITSASVLARKLKKLKPEIIIVVGGVHVSALTEESLYEFPEFDYVVKGEGEDSFLQLLQALEDNLAEINIQGVSYMKNALSLIMALL